MPGGSSRPAVRALHPLLQHDFRLATGVGMGGDDQVFENFLLVRLEQRRIDGQALQRALWR